MNIFVRQAGGKNRNDYHRGTRRSVIAQIAGSRMTKLYEVEEVYEELLGIDSKGETPKNARVSGVSRKRDGRMKNTYADCGTYLLPLTFESSTFDKLSADIKSVVSTPEAKSKL